MIRTSSVGSEGERGRVMTEDEDVGVGQALNELGEQLRYIVHDNKLSSAQVVVILGALMSSYTDKALDEV